MNLENLKVSQFHIIYLCVTTGIAFLCIILLKHYINKYRSKRISTVKKSDQFDAVETVSPQKNQTKKAKRKALENIDFRFSIIKRVFYYSIFLVWFIATIIPFIGIVPRTFVSIITTGGAIVLGIAAKPYVENVISGIVITFSKQLNLGDTVLIDGNYGIVEDISITHTVIKLWDWRRFIVPNTTMLQKDFINYSIWDPYQWAYVEFWISNDADIDLVKKTAIETASENKYSYDEEDPHFWIMEMTPQGAKCWVSVWAESPSDAWVMKAEIRSKLLMRLNKLGIKAHSYYINSEKTNN